MLNFANNASYTITLNVKDLLWGILILALIVLVLFIIALIYKAIKNLSATHKIIQSNGHNISKILENASNISTNANSVSNDIAHASNAFKPSVENIADVTESITQTFKDNNSINEAILKAYKFVNKGAKMAENYKNKKKNEEVADEVEKTEKECVDEN